MFLKLLKIPEHYKYILKIYFLGIILFTLFRLIFFINEYHGFDNIEQNKLYLVLMSFLTGLRFDIVISGYITAIPLTILFIASFFKGNKKIIYIIISFFFGIFYILAFAVNSADIPYFHHFRQRFSTSAFAWADTPDIVTGMIFGEFSYWIYIIPFLIFSLTFIFFLNKFRKKAISIKVEKPVKNRIFNNITFFILIFGMMFLGIRGRIQKMPIKAGTAYFSNHSLANQMGLNPNFTFIRSILDASKSANAEIKFIDEKKAIKFVQNQFNIPKKSIFKNPVARFVEKKDTVRKLNVVFVIMESMSADKTGILGKTELTPNLDSIAQNGILFSNIYSAGIHTHNGLYAILFGYPALKRQHPFKSVNIKKYRGLSYILKQNNYQTVYFTTHDGQFDNVEGFFLANSFDKVFAQDDYPSNEVISSMGVPDHYLFKYSINVLNNLHKNNKPFLSVFMTVSDHGPYKIPENISFKRKFKDVEKDIIRYADWSIGEFMKEAKKQDWFSNTLFVFVADHGQAMDATYDMPLSYHHIPLIFYSPENMGTTYVSDKLGSQIDVFPTALNILGLEYVNSTFGINLFKDKRKFAYFAADNNIACINNDYFWILRENGIETLHKFKTKDRNNYLKENSELVNNMKEYTFSMMQTAQYILKNNLQKEK